MNTKLTLKTSSLLPATLTTLLLLGGAGLVRAQSVVQEYYVPMPEEQIRQSFLTLAPATGATMDSVISIVVAVTGTKVIYDQWEDGYEVDLNASTQIWAAGKDANDFTSNPTQPGL